ncbi:MAG: outer membrane beta-barrel protein [Dysgonomonas sp.]
MSNQWSDNLRKRMEIHQEPSPEGLWMDIEQIIKQDTSVKTPPKQNKILLWSKRLGAVAAAILVIFFIGDYFMVENTQESQTIIQKKQTSYEHKNNLSSDQDNNTDLIAANNNNRILFHTKKDIAISVSKESSYTKDENSLVAKVEEIKDPKNETENTLDEPSIEEKVYNNQAQPKRQDRYNNIDQDSYSPVIRRRNKTTKWEAGVYASNISYNSAKKNEGYGSFVSGEVPSECDEENSALGDDPHNDILLQNKHKEVYTDIKHKQPIIIGVSANYILDDKWSLTSGLTYTILSSELRSGSDNNYYTSEQTLHNIGIPLNINYNVWKGKQVSVYLSVGGLVEKNVSGKLTTDYIVGNQFKSSEDGKISIERLQWSLNTSVGVQYNFSSRIGLYAEPGISNYFKNGSEVETIYKEKPLNFSLRFGLRFSLKE